MADGLTERLWRVHEMALALSAERKREGLLARILDEAQQLTEADGGTLYTVDDQRCLVFEILHTRSLDIHYEAGKVDRSLFPPIDLSGPVQTVAGRCAIEGRTFNIDDICAVTGFECAGTRKFDQATGYTSRSFLAVPLKNHEGEVIGVLQLINRQRNGQTASFDRDDCHLVEALASLAAAALTQHRLVADLNKMVESFIRVLADAIDEKSPYTGQHCRNVPEITMMLAEAVNKTKSGPLATVKFSEEELEELRIASWLHDCGKVTTPVHIVDKGTRLQAIGDREEIIQLRLEILRRDAKIRQLEGGGDTRYSERMQEIDVAEALVALANDPATFVDDAMTEKIRNLSQEHWKDKHGVPQTLLSADEVENLCIPRGTLTSDEREIINHHVVSSIKMLEKIPYPKKLRRVPQIAGAHHERMDGHGYPNGLTGDQMLLQARILAVADVFEALTAPNRPYKKAMPLSRVMAILDDMQKTGHLDPEVYQVFVDNKLYLLYGQKHLKPEQLDVK